MKHTITLTPTEVEEAVREYLENRGYICGCGSTNQANVARVQWVLVADAPSGFAECVVEGARQLRPGERPEPKPDCPDCGGKGYIDDGNNELPCRRCFPRLPNDWLRRSS